MGSISKDSFTIRSSRGVAVAISIGWILVFLASVALDFLIERDFPGVNNGVRILTLILATSSAIFVLTTYEILKNKASNLVALGLTAFLAVTAGFQIVSTGGLRSPYFISWLLVMLFAARQYKIYSLLFSYILLVAYSAVEIAELINVNSQGVFSDSTYINLFIAHVGYITLLFYRKEVFPGVARGTADVATKPSQVSNEDSSLDSLSEGFLRISKDGVIKAINIEAANILDWKKEDAIDLDFHSVFTFVDDRHQKLPDEENPIERILKGVPHVSGTYAIFTQNQAVKAVDMVIDPIKGDGDKAVLGAVLNITDITEEQAQESEKAEFISTASHEMRTPVAAIEGYLQLALTPNIAKVDAKGEEYLRKALDSTHHLGQLLQDLLTAARSEDGQLSSKPEVIEMGELINELIQEIRFTAEKKGLTVRSNASITGPNNVRPSFYVYADKLRLGEVITNLFTNAVKYTPEGSVSLTYSGNNDFVVVSVKDSGIGIAKSEIPHLFQKFYRIDNSETRTIGGTGLGLFIVRKVVEMYRGRVWVESEVGKGSTFFIALPRMSAEDVQKLNTGTVIMPGSKSDVQEGAEAGKMNNDKTTSNITEQSVALESKKEVQ